MKPELLIGLLEFIFAFGMSVWGAVVMYKEFLKNQIEKARLKAIDIESLKTLLAAKIKNDDDIKELFKNDADNEDSLRELQISFNETIKMFLQHQLRK